MPTVSVLMPTYNYGEFLARAIESVLEQDFTDLELVISDNASDDDSETIACRYAAQDSRVKYFRNASNVGLIGNFNLCYRRSNPESTFFIGLPADDWWDARLLEQLVSAARQYPEVTLLHCDAYRVEQDDTIINRYTDLFRYLPAAGPHQALAELLRNNYIPYQGTLVCREHAHSLYPIEDFHAAALPRTSDYHLWLQLLCRGAKAYFLNEPLAYIRKHEKASTMPSNIIPRLEQEVQTYQALRDVCPAEQQDLLRDVTAGRHAKLAFQLLQNSQPAAARNHLRQARALYGRYRLDISVASAISVLPVPVTLRTRLWNVARLAHRTLRTS